MRDQAKKNNSAMDARQLRAARALLGWSQMDLAEAAGISYLTVNKMEALGTGRCYARTVDAVRRAFETAGIAFIGEENEHGVGVRLALSEKPDGEKSNFRLGSLRRAEKTLIA